MSKIDEVRAFLQSIGMPKAQQADICCLSVLAMAGIKPDMPWRNATNEWIRIHDIIAFANSFYGTSYQVVHPELLKNSETRSFIDQIGIKQPSLKDQIYNIILPLITVNGLKKQSRRALRK